MLPTARRPRSCIPRRAHTAYRKSAWRPREAMPLSLAGNGVRWPPSTPGGCDARAHADMCVRRPARKERVGSTW
eukprot:3793576-Prymnesium_polylepis.1